MSSAKDFITTPMAESVSEKVKMQHKSHSVLPRKKITKTNMYDSCMFAVF